MKIRSFKSLLKFGHFRTLVLLLGLSAPALPAQVLVYVDFGGTATEAAGWNNLIPGTLAAAGTTISLVDSGGNATGYSMTITDPFLGSNSGGFAGPVDSFPSTATSDNLFGTGSPFNGFVRANPTIEISGLDTALSYTFDVYASRLGVSDNRSAIYTFTGVNSGSMEFDPSGNESDIFSISGISPTSEGIITFDMIASAANDSTSDFIHLSSWRMTSMTPVPEPQTIASLFGVFALVGVMYRRRRNRIA
jgi:hypothetical protein